MVFNKNKIAIILFLSILIISCKNVHETKQEKELFEWNAFHNSPALRGPSYCFVEFFYKGKAIAGNSMCIGDYGWCALGDGFANGDKHKSVPDSIAIDFICDLDLIQYTGGWKLPRKKMLALFDSVKRPKPYYPDSEYGYRYILAGVTPGGQVKIWIADLYNNIEIANFEASPVKYFVRGTEDDISRDCGGEGSFIDDQLDDFYIYNYLHPIPYGIWGKEEKKYDVDFGYCYEGEPSYIEYALHQSISKTGILYKGRHNEPLEVEWITPYGKPNLYDKIELPEQISFQTYSKELGDNMFYSEIVLPQNFEAIFSKGYKDTITGKQRFYNKIVFAVEKKSAVYNKYVYGKIQLDGVNKRIDIMRFRMVKKDTINDAYFDTRYSLPKNFVFKKWNGRLPIKKLDFKYWQEE